MNDIMHTFSNYVSLSRVLGGKNVFSQALFIASLLAVIVCKKLFGRTARKIHLSIEGRSIAFCVRDNADIAILSEVFVGREYDLPLPEVPQNIIDIGGHIGVTSLFLGLRYPSAKITTYEADPDNFAVLERNMSQFSNVTCVPAAVSNQSGQVHFFKSISSISSSLMPRDNAVPITARAIALDELLKERPDLVKYDVEGKEFDIFAGTPGLERCPVYLGEAHYDLFKKTKVEFASLFKGFTVADHGLSGHRSIVLATYSR